MLPPGESIVVVCHSAGAVVVDAVVVLVVESDSFEMVVVVVTGATLVEVLEAPGSLPDVVVGVVPPLLGGRAPVG